MKEYSECSKCGFVGVANYDAFEPAIIQCTNCEHVYSYIWCEKCGIGGDFISNFDEKPDSWSCSDCNTTISIPYNTYLRNRKLKAPLEHEYEEVGVPRENPSESNVAFYVVIILVIMVILYIYDLGV